MVLSILGTAMPVILQVLALCNCNFSMLLLTLQHVLHVPQLKRSLIRIGQVDDDGFHRTFGDGKWKICKGSRVIAKGSKSDTLYNLHVSSVNEHVVAVTEQPTDTLYNLHVSSVNDHVVAVGLCGMASWDT